MLPSRGACHGVFLLCHAARLGERRSRGDWVMSARSRSTFMANALDLDKVSEKLINLRLAVEDGHITVVDALIDLSYTANRATLIAIARILLLATPPFWLDIVVQEGQVFREYIPTKDMEALRWIDSDLDRFLLDSYGSRLLINQDNFAKRMGDVAELFIFSALEFAGAAPLHVAKLSDSYGYDIECKGGDIDRIEVKSAGGKTQKRFHISRNEYEKSVLYGSEWRLLQLVFSNRAFIVDKLNASHVDCIMELRGGALQELVPPDTDSFRWTESALITAPENVWRVANIALDPNFVTDGFH